MTKNTQLGKFAEEYEHNAYSGDLPQALRGCMDYYGDSITNNSVCLNVEGDKTKDVNGPEIDTQLIINDGLLKFKQSNKGKTLEKHRARCNWNDSCVGSSKENGKYYIISVDQSTGKPLSDYSNAEITKIDRINTSITYEDLKNHINKISYDSKEFSNFNDDYLDFRTSMGNIQLDEKNNATYTSDVLEEKIKPAFETTKNKHKEVKELRNELDNKMRELYGEKGDPDLNLDSSVYSTMLFTIMTTSLLYYLFVKM